MPVLNRKKRKQRNARLRALALSGAGAAGLLGGGALLAQRRSRSSPMPLPIQVVEIDRSRMKRLSPQAINTQASRVLVTSAPITGRGTARGGRVSRYQPTTALSAHQSSIHQRLTGLRSRLTGALVHVKGQGRHYADYVSPVERLAFLRRRAGRPRKDWDRYKSRIVALIAMLGANLECFHWLSRSDRDRL